MSPWSSLLTLLVGGLWSWLIFAFAIGYFLGSIPFGLVLTRLAGAGDVRKQGSGNIGATNVLRTGKKGLAFGTLLLDGLKGTAAVLIADHFYGQGAALFAGLGAFLGHVFPIWLKLRGGKGVATMLGIIAAFDWSTALVFAVTWIIAAAVTRYSSVAGIFASISVPLAFWLTGQNAYAVVSAVMAIILIAKHYANIKRLISGTETKIGVRT